MCARLRKVDCDARGNWIARSAESEMRRPCRDGRLTYYATNYSFRTRGRCFLRFATSVSLNASHCVDSRARAQRAAPRDKVDNLENVRCQFVMWADAKMEASPLGVGWRLPLPSQPCRPFPVLLNLGIPPAPLALCLKLIFHSGAAQLLVPPQLAFVSRELTSLLRNDFETTFGGGLSSMASSEDPCFRACSLMPLLLHNMGLVDARPSPGVVILFHRSFNP